MRNRSKLLLVGLCASFLLAAAVGTASANHLSVNETGYRIHWSELAFSMSGLTPITCALELSGSFHSATINKTIGSLIGATTAGTIGNCRGGGMTIHRETLPWHIQYGGFTGTLPNITKAQLNLVGARWRIHPEGSLECEGGTTQSEPGILTIALGTRHEATSVSASGTISERGQFLCEFATMTLSGSGTVTTASGGTIVIRLI